MSRVQDTFRKRPRGWLIRNVWAAKTRAKKANVPFDLKPSDLAIPRYCPVLGIPLVIGGPRDTSPSLDRLIPRDGYTKENVRIISFKANRLKNNATLDELKSLVLYIESQQRNR